MTEIELAARGGLPDALRVLLDEFPREAWAAHPHFVGMVQFWLRRHLMFRDLTGRLRAEVRAVLERETAPAAFAPRLARLGGFFLNELHMHHRIEDEHYFPRLAQLDARLEAGFGMLDADHHALATLLGGFADAANAVLRAEEDAIRDAAGPFDEGLSRLARLLDRHLTDEEDLIVPVILKSGFAG